MKKLVRALIALALFAPTLAAAAIAFVNPSSGSSGLGTTQTVTLPTGYNSAGDMTILIATEDTTGTITVPTGWTTVFNASGSVVVYRFYQGGDPSSITFTLGTNSRWGYAASTYSGVDSTTPIDVSQPTVMVSGGSGSNSTQNKYAQLMKWPSVNPTYSSDQLLLLSGYGGSLGGGKPTAPGGSSSRANQNGQTVTALFDKALSSTANTGEFQSTGITYNTSPIIGVTVGLKTSGASHATAASPQVTAAGLHFNLSSSGTSCPVTLENTSNGALVAVFAAVSGTGTVTAPGGYASAQSGAGGGLWTHTWLTGDTTSPSFTISSAACATLALTLVGAGSTNTPAVDASGTNAGASSVSVSALAPSGSNVDYAWFMAWLKNVGASANSGLGPGTMTTDQSVCSGFNACEAVLQQNGITSSLGAFTATIDAGGAAQVGVAALFSVAANAPANTTQPVLIMSDRRAAPQLYGR